MKKLNRLFAVIIIVGLLFIVLLIFSDISVFHSSFKQPTSVNHNVFAVEQEVIRKNVNTLHDLSGDKKNGNALSSSSSVVVAIGLAVTSRGIINVTRDNIRYKFPFFRSLLSSFCKTSTQGYSYKFYVAYDLNDAFFLDSQKLPAFEGITHVHVTRFSVDSLYSSTHSI